MPSSTSTSTIPYSTYLLLEQIAAGHPVALSYRKGRRMAVQDGHRVSMRDVDRVENWLLAEGLRTLTPAGQDVVAAFGRKT